MANQDAQIYQGVISALSLTTTNNGEETIQRLDEDAVASKQYFERQTITVLEIARDGYQCGYS